MFGEPIMSEMQQLRYFCTNELCHYEFTRLTDHNQTSKLDCPTCGNPLVLEES